MRISKMSPYPTGYVKRDHTIWTGALMMAVKQLEYRVLMERQSVHLPEIKERCQSDNAFG
jgi:hypothetical protein